MEIKSKFSIGDTAYFLKESGIWECKVYAVIVYVGKDGIAIRYGVHRYDCGEQQEEVTEENLFPTIEELANDLKKNVNPLPIAGHIRITCPDGSIQNFSGTLALCRWLSEKHGKDIFCDSLHNLLGDNWFGETDFSFENVKYHYKYCK